MPGRLREWYDRYKLVGEVHSPIIEAGYHTIHYVSEVLEGLSARLEVLLEDGINLSDGLYPYDDETRFVSTNDLGRCPRRAWAEKQCPADGLPTEWDTALKNFVTLGADYPRDSVRNRVLHLVALGAALEMFVDDPSIEVFDVPSVRRIYAGYEPGSVWLTRKLRRRPKVMLGATVVQLEVHMRVEIVPGVRVLVAFITDDMQHKEPHILDPSASSLFWQVKAACARDEGELLVIIPLSVYVQQNTDLGPPTEENFFREVRDAVCDARDWYARPRTSSCRIDTLAEYMDWLYACGMFRWVPTFDEVYPNDASDIDESTDRCDVLPDVVLDTAITRYTFHRPSEGNGSGIPIRSLLQAAAMYEEAAVFVTNNAYRSLAVAWAMLQLAGAGKPKTAPDVHTCNSCPLRTTCPDSIIRDVNFVHVAAPGAYLLPGEYAGQRATAPPDDVEDAPMFGEDAPWV